MRRDRNSYSQVEEYLDANMHQNNITVLDTPLFNIFITASYQPEQFRACLKSILEQTYTRYRVIVSYSDDRCKEYLNEYQSHENITIFKSYQDDKSPENIYINEALSKADEGWNIVLNDSDTLTHNMVLEQLRYNMQNNNNNILYWKVKEGNKIFYPKNVRDIKREEIACSGFCFHSNYTKQPFWAGTLYNKTNFIVSLLQQKNLRHVFIDMVLVNSIKLRVHTEKILRGPRYFTTTKYSGNNQAALYNLNQLSNKIGVIITTNGFNGIFARQCIECYLREMPSNAYIVLYINESSDPITLNLKNEFPSIEVIYVEDQITGGGLTGTWNKGIDLCFYNNCDIIIVSNDDILFDESILNICLEAGSLKDTDMVYFGPHSNNPGNETNNIQLGFPQDKNNVLCTNNKNLWNINGFFMVFTKTVLLKNKFNEKYYFDPAYPFGGNESEWFDRFKKIGGKGMVVPKTFIYHYKLARWRDNKKLIKNNICIYTINTGGYEGSEIYLNTNLGYDCLYFTDNFVNVYNCVKKGIIPFYVDTSNKEAKLVQRMIKTNVHQYVPEMYDKSIYIDGNVIIKNSIDVKNNLKYLLNLNSDIICFKHPDRSNILDEADAVKSLNLEKKENIDKIIEMFVKENFKDDMGLTETNFLIRNHKLIKNFNKEWEECIKICRRDQISFDFLLYKHKVNYIQLSFSQKMIVIEKKKHINTRKREIS